MKRINFPLWLIAGSSVFFVFGVFNSAGKAGKTGAPGENTCIQCHAGAAINSGGGSVSINGSFTNGEYVEGQSYAMNVEVSQTGIGLFGFSIVALDENGMSVGTFAAGTDNHTENATVQGNVRQYLTHNTDGGLSNDNHMFHFQWTAPAVASGPVTFYATGNAADANGGTTGDKIYSTSISLNEVTPISVANAGLNQDRILWNTAERTIMCKSGSDLICQWQVFDASGRLIINENSTSNREFKLENLTSGIFVVKCSIQGKILEKKIVL